MEEQPNQKLLRVDQQQTNENNPADQQQQQQPLRVIGQQQPPQSLCVYQQQQQQQQLPLHVDQQQNNDNDNGGIVDAKTLQLEIFKNFPPGYRFNPRDDELITYYLYPKINGQQLPLNLMFDVNIYQDHPRVITALYPAQEGNWYFFTARKKIYPHGGRPKRQAGDGRWKPIGSTTDIYINGEKIGGKRLLEYEEKKKKAHNSVMENWGMREYWIEESSERREMRKNSATVELDCVLSIIYKKGNKTMAPKKKGKEPSQKSLQPKNPDNSRKRKGKESSEAEETNEPPKKRKEIVLGGSGPRVHAPIKEEEVVPVFRYGPMVDNDVWLEISEPMLSMPPSTSDCGYGGASTTTEYFNPSNNLLFPSSTSYEYGGTGTGTGVDGNIAGYYSNMNDLTIHENGGGTSSSTQSTHKDATNSSDDGNDFERWTDLHSDENDFMRWTDLHWK